MKSIDIDQMDNLPGRRIADGETFRFACHGELACFNRCCRNLNLFIYPYDVMRLKNALGMRSEAFLDRHVDVVMREGNHFPDVLLTMADNAEKTCPFLTGAGCRVYADRPDACRTFPVEQGRYFDARTGKSTVVHFFRPPDFCLGQHESQVLTPAQWADDQDAHRHHLMTHRWADIKSRFQENPWGASGPNGQQAKMAFMAVYNIDRFREFLFDSSFFKRYAVKSDLKRKLSVDDDALLAFGFDWVEVFVWGVASKRMRPR
ncbi:MAG: YkgJ family cysteine cluster protein [Pseudomonadota bacterium]